MKTFHRLQFVSLTLLTIFTAVVSAETYHVTPTTNDKCPEGSVSCRNLSQYTSTKFPSNTTLILLPGNHRLDSELAFANISYLEIITTGVNAMVMCDPLIQLSFNHIAHVRINDIKFIGCRVFVSLVNQLAIEESYFIKDNQNKTGLYLHLIELAHISECTFSSHGGSDIPTECSDSELVSGGAIHIKGSNVSIDNCLFTHNTAGMGGALYIIGSNVIPAVENTPSSLSLRSIVTIHNSTFTHNCATNLPDSGGAIYVHSSTIIVDRCLFSNNNGRGNGGAISAKHNSVVHITHSHFVNNIVNDSIVTSNRYRGGAVYVSYGAVTTINNSWFFNNSASLSGGGVYSRNAILTTNNCEYYDNTAKYGGAVYVLQMMSIAIYNTTFTSNTVSQSGGAVYTEESTIEIGESLFEDNAAYNAGGLHCSQGTAVIINSVFRSNRACHWGGGAHIINNNTVLLENISFVDNRAIQGASLSIYTTVLNTTGYVDVLDNMANVAALYVELSTLTLSGMFHFSNNNGSLYAYSSNVTFSGNAVFNNNLKTTSSPSLYPEGGALTLFLSNLFINGATNFTDNTALSGGAISATESKLYMYSNIYITDNTGLVSGGGIFAYQSDMNFKGSSFIVNNFANESGGGIHTVSSTIMLSQGSLHISNNTANYGGGVYCESNAKLYILKPEPEWRKCYEGENCNLDNSTWLKFEFIGNSAEYGGAIYVSDGTTSNICETNRKFSSNECFLQTIPRHGYNAELNTINFYFSDNSANHSGTTLYGGLIDRCRVNPHAEIFNIFKFHDRPVNPNSVNGLMYLENITSLRREHMGSEIASMAVFVCFCVDDRVNCSDNYQPPTVKVKKGHRFTVSVVSVDQINTEAYGVVRSFLSSGDAGLGTGQNSQITNGSCTELEYNIYSPHHSEELFLYAEGPCNNTGKSQRSVKVEFLDCECPIGFQQNSQKDTECECICDSRLSQYVDTCVNGTLKRSHDFWITYLNDSDTKGIAIYPHCPYNHCIQPTTKVYVNLSMPNGSDSQCNFSRTGILCGACKDGLSLSLGSSRCLPCENHNGLALVILFAIAGIALVAFILVCNLTVAVGTINGLIFYANIVAANRSIFLPFDRPNPLSIFVSWVNLDFGFETCFFNGMDGYGKTWLQLAFPVYIMFLVAMVITLSEHSSRFSRLLSKYDTNPITTLDTLILLSYAKLLRTIIFSLSFGYLQHPNGSVYPKKYWLFDANIPYLQGKHIPLFIAAVLILAIGIIYTTFLLFWQWFLRLPHKKALNALRNVRFNSFIEPYHAPYNPRHRYWTGLLLLVRAFLYLISAVNIKGDPSINILCITCVVGSILLIKELVLVRIYKNLAVNALETSFLFNTIIFSVLTLYFREREIDQKPLAFTSTSIAFFTFVGILIYHLYAYVFLKAVHKRNRVKAKKSKPLRGFADNVTHRRPLIQQSDEHSSNIPNCSSLSSSSSTSTKTFTSELVRSVSYTEFDALPDSRGSSVQRNDEEKNSDQKFSMSVRSVSNEMTSVVKLQRSNTRV